MLSKTGFGRPREMNIVAGRKRFLHTGRNDIGWVVARGDDGCRHEQTRGSAATGDEDSSPEPRDSHSTSLRAVDHEPHLTTAP